MPQTPSDPSMEDILASIRKVIDEDRELREAAPALRPESAGSLIAQDGEDDTVLELDQPFVPSPAAETAEPKRPAVAAAEAGPALLSDHVADASRQSLAALAEVAASAPPSPPPANPLEAMVREMLRPILKEWLDDHLPGIVDQHVKREIARITGKPL